MKTIKIKESVKIPGTNIILEKNDRIFYSHGYGLVEYISDTVNWEVVKKGITTLTGTSLGIKGNDKVFISDAPEYNDLVLRKAEEWAKKSSKYIPGGMSSYAYEIKTEIPDHDIRSIPELITKTFCREGCLIAVVTPKFTFKVKKVVFGGGARDREPREMKPSSIKDILRCRNLNELATIAGDLFGSPDDRKSLDLGRPHKWFYSSGMLESPKFLDPWSRSEGIDLPMTLRVYIQELSK